MDDEEKLRQLSYEVWKTLKQSYGTKDKILQDSISQLARLISHMISEERNKVLSRQDMNNIRESIKMYDTALFGDKNDREAHPGIVNEWITFKKFMEGNRKIHYMVLSSVTGLLIKAFWDVVWPLLIKHPS